MSNGTKIATCCYCGTRAALILRGRDRHELACANCGAPLHDLKMLRSDAISDRNRVRPVAERDRRGVRKSRKITKPRKYRSRKSLSRRFMEEVFDRVEDVFEEIFD